MNIVHFITSQYAIFNDQYSFGHGSATINLSTFFRTLHNSLAYPPMLGIENQLPLIVAGVHEGKNEIKARVGYFNLGINLKTEWPKPAQIKKAAEEVFGNITYRENVIDLSKEFCEYDPNKLTEYYINEIFARSVPLSSTRSKQENTN